MENTNVIGRANSEWATRPADQSFLSLEDLHRAVVKRFDEHKEAKRVAYSDLRIAQGEAGRLQLVGKANVPVDFTHWSFGQLSRAVGAPAGFLRELPSGLAAEVLNDRLMERGKDAGEAKLLMQVNGTRVVRAFTGVDYARIWDKEITGRAMQLQEQGWNAAPVTELAGGGQTRGLYASDHDVFLFLVDNDRRVFEKAPGGGLSRGIMIANSEVGDKSFWALRFLYSYVCANHNVWGAQGAQELRIRHVGQARARAFGELEVELRSYAESSAAEDEAKIRRCMAHEIAPTKELLLDRLFGLKSLALGRKTIEGAYELAEQHEDWYGSPRSAWGIGNGLSEAAKAIPFADERVKAERAAGRVFEMSF